MSQSSSSQMEPLDRKPLPNYEVVPLRSDEITVAAVQPRMKQVDPKNPKPVLRENLEHISLLVDLAQVRGHVDLVCFIEFVLQGSAIRFWTREDFLRLAIELPGEESEFIGKKAKEYDCYIVVAGYTKDKDWPGHFFNCVFIVSPTGKIIHKHWKAHFNPGFLEYATTAHDVLDEFVKRYGWDAVWPVARTDIGNIAPSVCSEGMLPETARVYAFKGAEIFVRLMTGGGATTGGRPPGVGDPRIVMQAQCMSNDIYGIYTNNAYGVTGDYAIEEMGGGFTMIIDNRGTILQQAESLHETLILATIPIASFRRRHSIPVLRQELYAPAYAEYEGKYPPNMYSEYLPKDHWDAINYARRKAKW